MGLFDWLFGRPAPAPASAEPAGAPEPAQTTEHAGASRRSKLPRPTSVQQLGEHSPLVAFEQNGAMVLMDRDAFDYTYGDADGPDPAQADLDAVLPTITRVCVMDGAMFQGHALGGRVLIETRDAGAIQELAGCLRIVEDPRTFNHCSCLGGPTIELYAGREHVATIGLQHGRALRWNRWYHDAQLQDGDRLTRWLQAHGVAPAQLAAIYQRGNNFLMREPGPSSARQQEARQLGAQAQERAQEGKLAEAAALCTRGLALDPDLLELLALRGQVFYHLERVSEAIADCSAAIERGYRHAETYFVRAIAQERNERTDEALADCSMALHLNPDHAGAYSSRGVIRLRLGQLDQALEDFAQALRREPRWFLPYFYRAQCHHNRAEMEAALADYDQAVECLNESTVAGEVPDSSVMPALLHCRRGDALYDQFREEEAEADFAEARRREPATAASYLADMWLRRSKFELAKQAFSEIVEHRPEDARGYTGRGLAQESLGNVEEASADYSEAIRLAPDGGAAYVLRAGLRQRQGRTDEALADLSAHLQFHPDDATAYLSRAALHKQRGSLGETLRDLNEAHRVAPDHPIVCNNLAWLLATCRESGLRDGARAVTLARQACQTTEWKHAYCLGTLAAALAETGAFKEATAWQAEALALYPEQEKAAGQARLALYETGQPYRE
jgi:tetratricopeptide (TPR) repeat protein